MSEFTLEGARTENDAATYARTRQLEEASASPSAATSGNTTSNILSAASTASFWANILGDAAKRVVLW